MSMDTRLRAEGQRLRERVRGTLEVEVALEGLLAERRRRRRRAGLATALTAAATVAVITSMAGWVPSGGPTPPALTPTRPQPSTPAPAACEQHEALRCIDDGVRVRGPVTYRMGIPTGFVLDPDLDRAPFSVQAFQQHADGGVTVITSVAPADESVRTGARELAAWVADRPFLDAGDVERTSVGRVPAWSVRVALDVPPATVPEPSCNGFPQPCWAVLREADGWETGLWTGMASRYWFVDLPGGDQVLGVWSWSRDEGGLRANNRLVRSLVLESVI